MPFGLAGAETFPGDDVETGRVVCEVSCIGSPEGFVASLIGRAGPDGLVGEVPGFDDIPPGFEAAGN